MRFPDDVPTLTEGDVTLRAHRLDDVPGIVEQCVDPVSVRWTTVPMGYTRDLGVDWVRSTVPAGWKAGTELTFAIESTHPDGVRRFSGSLSLRNEGAHRAELAFGAHPAVRGRGVMTTAVNLLLDWGFADQGLESVVWLANTGNWASRRVAWKVGFTFGGTVRRWLEHRGEHLDAWIGSLHHADSREPKSPWLDVPRISGDRLLLRPFRDDDAPRIAEGCSDSRTQHWLSFMPRSYTIADAHDWLERSRLETASGKGLFWAIVDPDTDLLLGNVGMPRILREGAEVGYWMHPDGRGWGLMKEAVSLVVRHAFLDVADGGLGMHRVFLKAALGNTASQKVARGNGFSECGRERQAETLGDGSRDDLLVFDLLPLEWRTFAAAAAAEPVTRGRHVHSRVDREG
jgi:RimJ/RimL family protein N-acetyltransferase